MNSKNKNFDYISLHEVKKYALRLNQNTLLMENLTQFAKDEHITFAEVYGIGALNNLDLGCFSVTKKAYERVKLEEPYELTSVMGNISMLNKEPMAHIHITLAGMDHHVIGGHLFEATVAVTTELFITSYQESVERTLIPKQCQWINTWTFH